MNRQNIESIQGMRVEVECFTKSLMREKSKEIPGSTAELWLLTNGQEAASVCEGS